MEENQNKQLEYILLTNLEYEYEIEEFLIDINKFEKLEESETQICKKNKDDKKSKKEKGKDNKSKKGKDTGNKKKKNEKDELALSKESSKMSIYSTKPNNTNKPNMGNLQLGQKIKVAVGKGKTMNITIDKNKMSHLNKILAAQERLEKLDEKEEIVVTTKVEKTEEKKEEASVANVANNKNSKNKKNKNEKSENSEKTEKPADNKVQETNKKPTQIETKENKDTAGQNKRVEDFLKSVKEKKGANKNKQTEEKVSIKSSFLDKHKYLFTVDPAQRLRLRDMAQINSDVIENFFEILNATFESFNTINDEEFIKTNVKDAAIIIDNLSEISFNTNKIDLIELIFVKALTFIVNHLESKNLNKVIILNVLYTIFKFKNENNDIKLDLSLLSKISTSISATFSQFLNEKLTKKGKSLREDEDILFFTFARNLLFILNSENSKIIDENIEALLKYTLLANESSDFDEFLIDYSNLRFFTKFSHLFDLNKSKFYNLSIKCSRAIEAKLTEFQNILIRQNTREFSIIINHILFNYINNFPEYFEIQENLYDDIFNLLKFICDDKTLTSNYIQEIFMDSSTSKQQQQINIKLTDHYIYSDDVLSKYIILIIKYIKYFERVFTKEDGVKATDEETNIFLFYFNKVLSIILNLKPGYLREKYVKILEKTIEAYLSDSLIAEKIFNYITDVIRNGLMNNLSTNLLQSIKNLKDLIKFYSNYKQIKGFMLKLFDKEIKEDLEFSFFSIFYLNFLNLNNKDDYQLLDSLITNSKNFVENLLFIDKRLCSYLTKYYINEEINSLENVINLITKNSLAVSFDHLIEYLYLFLEKTLNNGGNRVNNINMIFNIIEKFIQKENFNFEKLVIFSERVFDIILNVNKNNLDSDESVVIYSIVIFLLNKVSQNKELDLLKFYSQVRVTLEKIYQKVNGKAYVPKYDLLNEITLINDKLKNPNEKEYFKSFDDIVFTVLDLLNLDRLLKNDANYFKVENILVENVEISAEEKENTEIIKEKINLETGEVIKINNEDVEKIEKSKENKTGTIQIPKFNLDMVLFIFKNYFNHVDFLFKNSTIKSGCSNETILLNFSSIQETINIIFSNDLIFNNLIQSRKLLEEFIKKYLEIKEKTFDLSQLSLKDLNKLEAQSKDEENTFLLKNLDQIRRNLVIVELSEKCAVYCGDFVKYRCKDQIVFLFREDEIYKMFLTKDKQFLKLLFDKFDETYKTTIINEENIKNLIAKAQNEDEDLLEEVVHSIFSKSVIKYLECPEEIIEFLSTMNEALKFDLKLSRKEFYNSLFPYFYIWKTIMSKIENGFKLYTTDKQYVNTIDTYKTLLKFVINYLERNTKLYEMFLLLVVSLIHLIDDERSLEERSEKTINYKLNNFDDSLLSDMFDKNTLQFFLSVLYKFVKIFPSLVKFYYDESKTKLKNVFKSLNTNIILPNMLIDLKERIGLNSDLLSKYQLKVRETKSLNYIEFDFNANDEIKFLIEVKIPPIFPLKKLDINFKCNALIDERKLLNVKMNLNQTMNSSIDNITDNLIIWAENVRQLIIVGQEPCPVCYSYLHGTDKSLPNSTCKTCKKKFHSLCMKEWFKNLARNGQKYSCPMCRSEWKIQGERNN